MPDKKCLLCKGEGTVKVHTGIRDKKSQTCPMCLGQGYFTEESKERFFAKLMRRKGMYYHG